MQVSRSFLQIDFPTQIFILSVKRENLEDGGGLKVDIVGQGMASVWC